jgi:site-specific DNA-methyltransferase (adenine-specific)
MKLYQGDCLEVMKQIPDKSIDMILCDLPYGTTACKWDTIIPFDKLWEQYNRIIKDNGAVVLFGSEPFSSALRMSNIKNFKYDWVWNKKQTGNPFLAKKQPLKIHEIISVFNTNIYCPIMRTGKMRIKGGSKESNIKVFGGTDKTQNNIYYPTSILDFPNCANKSKKLHPTQKPVELCEYLIRTYTNDGDTVLDNCMGSGTTGVACKHLNRNFIGIELDEEYFKIAEKRIKGELK